MSRDDDITRVIHREDGKLLSPEQIAAEARLNAEIRELESALAVAEWQAKRGFVDPIIAEKAAEARARGVRLNRNGKATRVRRKTKEPKMSREASLGKVRGII
jgi:hypothetical protein